MKKKIFLFVLLLSIFTLTACGNNKKYYEGYKYLNFKEVLEAESFELENTNYEESDDQAIIYLFRGQGCGFCRSFISFLNSISEEYGKYFKVVSFEVWYDKQNNELWSKMPEVTNVAAQGVPYIIIGDKVYDGYTSSYDEEIKAQIMKQYKDKSYDVFDELYKYENGFKGFSTDSLIIINLIIIVLCTTLIILNNNHNSRLILDSMNKEFKEVKPYKDKKANKNK